MPKRFGNCGFSLIEILLAIGTLAVGMIFIGGVFPVALHFTTIATERTIAAVVADEAFAKIRLYADADVVQAGDFELSNLEDFNDNINSSVDVNSSDYTYPSTISVKARQYSWSALCRRVGSFDVQVTVFVCRKVRPNLKYWNPNGGEDAWPMLVPVKVSGVRGFNELMIDGNRTLINDGYTIVDDETGQIYRVLERYVDNDDTILLDRDWDEDGDDPDYVWVVPPPVNGGRYPCIGIYQKIIRF